MKTPFKLGVYIPATKTVCTDIEQCEQQNPSLEPGKLYEADLTIEPRTPFTPQDTPTKIYNIIQAIRQQYPGVIINYIYISDDGKHVKVQMFDTPGWRLIAVLILILAIAIVSYTIVNMVIRFLDVHLPEGPPTPKDPYFWLMIATAITLPAVGVGYLVKQVKKR